MSELREEKRHKIRPGEDRTGDDVVEALDKTADRIESKLWMKWGVVIVCALLTVVGWFSTDFINRIRIQAEEGHKALDMMEPHMKEFEEMKKEQKRMVRNVDRMTIFFETKWGMPREARRSRIMPPNEEDN